jgi:hypothetical protein
MDIEEQLRDDMFPSLCTFHSHVKHELKCKV